MSLTAHKTRPHREKDVMWLVLGALALLGSLLIPLPEGDSLSLDGGGRTTVPTICWFKRTTGLDCAGCGLTRSFVAMGHLDPKRAWGFHRMGPVLYAAAVLQIPYRLAHILAERKGKPLRRFPRRLTRWIHVTALILILANWACKLGTGSAFP